MNIQKHDDLPRCEPAEAAGPMDLEQHLGDLDQMLDILDGQVAELIRKLAPVLLPEGSDGGATPADTVSRTPTSDYVDLMTRHVHRLVREVAQATERVYL